MFTVPLGNPEDKTNLVSVAPFAGIVIFPEELEANLLSSGTVEVLPLAYISRPHLYQSKFHQMRQK